MDYTLRELECFMAVAEELSFTRAALKLRLAQPPLSRHVRSLEEKIGARLFERSARRVTLTAPGARFYDETRTILPQLIQATEAARRSASGESVRLRLGFVSAVLSPELVEVLREFRTRHPTVQVLVQDISPTDQLAALRRGTLDGGFIGLKPDGPSPGVRYVSWLQEALMAFVPSGHALAERRDISLRELAGDPWVAVSSEAAPTFSALVRRRCADAGFRPRVVLESARAQAVAVMVAAGVGVALLPASLARITGSAAIAIPLRQPVRLPHVFACVAGPTTDALRSLIVLLGVSARPNAAASGVKPARSDRRPIPRLGGG